MFATQTFITALGYILRNQDEYDILILTYKKIHHIFKKLKICR